MKQFSFVIIVILLTIILFSMFKYANDEPVFENMSQGRFMVVSAIVDDDSPTTSTLEKITALKTLNISDPKINDILNSDVTNKEKLQQIKKTISSVTL